MKLNVIAVAVIALFVLVACPSLFVQPEQGAIGAQAYGDTNVTNLVASGDVTVGDDLSVTDDTTFTGDLGVDGAANLDEVDIDGVTNLVVGTEHIGVSTWLTASVTYTPTTGTLATIGDGEVWFIHGLVCNVTTNFDCTGDDCTLTVGDGNDADGFLAAADAALQTTFTEDTGFAAGWFGMETAAENGAYTLDDGQPMFVYAPSGSDETIDYTVGGTDPAAGEVTCYIRYTRFQ